MCQAIAERMLRTLKTCTLYAKANAYFERSAARGNCDAMWGYYDRLVRERPDVGRGIQRSGGKPIETVRREMERLYQEHRNNVKVGNRP